MLRYGRLKAGRGVVLVGGFAVEDGEVGPLLARRDVVDYASGKKLEFEDLRTYAGGEQGVKDYAGVPLRSSDRMRPSRSMYCVPETADAPESPAKVRQQHPVTASTKRRRGPWTKRRREN